MTTASLRGFGLCRFLLAATLLWQICNSAAPGLETAHLPPAQKTAAVAARCVVRVGERHTIDIDAQNTPLSVLLSHIAVKSGVNLALHAPIDPPVNLTLYRAPFYQALQTILRPLGLVCQEESGQLMVVAAKGDAPFGLQTQTFHSQHLDFAAARQAVLPLLSAAGSIRRLNNPQPATAPAAASPLFKDAFTVEDYPAKVAQVAALLQKLNAPKEQINLEIALLKTSALGGDGQIITKLNEWFAATDNFSAALSTLPRRLGVRLLANARLKSADAPENVLTWQQDLPALAARVNLNIYPATTRAGRVKLALSLRLRRTDPAAWQPCQAKVHQANCAVAQQVDTEITVDASRVIVLGGLWPGLSDGCGAKKSVADASEIILVARPIVLRTATQASSRRQAPANHAASQKINKPRGGATPDSGKASSVAGGEYLAICAAGEHCYLATAATPPAAGVKHQFCGPTLSKTPVRAAQNANRQQP